MIRKMRSKLSVKVFILTFLLLTACCGTTYGCIARFAPYIYTYEPFEAEEIAEMLAYELGFVRTDEAAENVLFYQDILTGECEEEFRFHIFRSSGEEVSPEDFNVLTGKSIETYQETGATKTYSVLFTDDQTEYLLLAARNTDKESQIIEALRKAFPVICVIVLAVSVISALFYTWYMTKPIKRISKISRQMADMDFGGICETNRTDEIGILYKSLNELSTKLAAALSDLRKANQRLQRDIDLERELERQRTDFFAAASHELKTPITIIRGQLEGMLYQVGRYQDRETYLVRSLEVTDTLEKMVQELLLISRLDMPGVVYEKEEIDFSRLINERLAAHADLFLVKNLTAEAYISPEIHITGDRKLLLKALDNLLGNAAAYSGEGECICVKLWETAGKINLTIENTGVHIPDEEIPRLFEAFYRVEQSRNRQSGGTGLGLYIVKTILDMHGAELEIANTDRGVIVSVVLLHQKNT